MPLKGLMFAESPHVLVVDDDRDILAAVQELPATSVFWFSADSHWELEPVCPFH